MNPEESLDRGVSLKNDESKLEYVVFITEIPLRSAYPEMEYGNKLHAAMRLKVIPQRMSIMSGKQSYRTFAEGPRADTAPRKDQRNCRKGPDNTARREAVVLMFS